MFPKSSNVGYISIRRLQLTRLSKQSAQLGACTRQWPQGLSGKVDPVHVGCRHVVIGILVEFIRAHKQHLGIEICWLYPLPEKHGTPYRPCTSYLVVSRECGNASC